MNIYTSNTDQLRRYLLDDLTDEERGVVEAHFMSDDSVFDDIIAVEDELFYEYQENELTVKERRVFEQKFLRSKEDRVRAEFAGGFLNATKTLSSEHSFAAVPATEDQPSMWQSIIAFFNFGSALQFGMAAAALILSLGVIALLVQNSRMRNDIASIQQQNESDRRDREAQLAEKQRQQQAIEDQLAAEREKANASEDRLKELEVEKTKLQNDINERRNRLDRNPNVSQPGGLSTIATLIISPGRFTRSDGVPMNRIVLSPEKASVNLRLALKNVDDYEKFGVSVVAVDTGNTVLTRTNIAASGKGGKRSVSLNIPAKSLQRADYEVILTGVAKTGEAEEITKYYFSVDK